MPTAYQINNQGGSYYLTLQIVYWADVFTRKECRDIAIDSLGYCRKNKGLEIYAYVIMSNHVHLLVKSSSGRLSDTIRDLKRHTSKRIIDFIKGGNESRKDWLLMIFEHAAKKHIRNRAYQVWTHENHAEEIYSEKFIDQKIDYIHNNPIKAGIVENGEDYLYSSARNYAELDSLLEIDFADRHWKTID